MTHSVTDNFKSRDASASKNQFATFNYGISRIKTNTTGAEFLYLPLEVEVSAQPGLYCPQVTFGSC